MQVESSVTRAELVVLATQLRDAQERCAVAVANRHGRRGAALDDLVDAADQAVAVIDEARQVIRALCGGAVA
jgi:hypothetical protein